MNCFIAQYAKRQFRLSISSLLEARNSSLFFETNDEN
jgi:hypothetical protein